jgi:hypothetical protein
VAKPPRVKNAMKIASQSSSAQMTPKEDSLNPNLDFSQITQTSQRGLGESSQRLRNECVSWMTPAPSKGGKGKASILVPQKLAIGNLPVKIRTSSFRNLNIRNLKTSHCRQNCTLQFGKLE